MVLILLILLVDTFNGADNEYGIYNSAGGDIVISGGEIMGREAGIYSNGNVTINGTASVLALDYGTNSPALIANGDESHTVIIGGESRLQGVQGIDVTGTNTVTIEENATIRGDDIGINNESTATINIKGGDIGAGGDGVQNNSTGTIIVTGGAVGAEQRGILNHANGTVRIRTGMVHGNNFGLANDAGGTVAITGGTVEGKTGIINQGTGTVTIRTGTVIGQNSDGVQNTSTGTLIIGSQSDELSIENPNVTGETYGLRIQSGTINFYNGILKGGTSGYSGTISSVRMGYEIKTGTDGTYQTAYLSGPIPIYTAEQMSWVGDGQVHTISQENGAQYVFAMDGNYILKNDIDLSSTNWTAIGTSNNPFSGTFLGDGHEINLNMSNSVEKAVLGVFGYVGNCTIDGLGVTGNISTNINATIGAVAAYVNANTTCNITNCYNSATISSTTTGYSIGGLVGDSRGTLNMTNCYNTGSVTGANNTAGILAFTNGIVVMDKCYNAGTIINTGGNYAGGLIGRNNNTDSNITITNSYNIADVIGNTYAGGLIADNIATLTIINSYNQGNVQGKNAAGILGFVDASKNSKNTIRNVYNIGTITGTTKSAGILNYSTGNTVTLTKAYYKNNVSAGATGTTSSELISMSDSAMRNNSFATTLNTNRVTITGYELLPWKIGDSQYPEFGDDSKNYSITNSGNITYYQTLQEAYEDAISGGGDNGGGTIKVEADAVMDDSTVAINKNLKLNTNGKILTRLATITVNSGRTFEIAGSGTLSTSEGINLITNAGTLNITHTGTIENTNTGSYNVIRNTGTVNKTGTGTIYSTTTSDAINGGNISISSGTVSSSGWRTIYTSGTFTMTGGTVISTNKEAVYALGSTAQVSGGTIRKGPNTDGTSYEGAAFRYNGTGTATISSGTIEVLLGSAENVVRNGSTGTIIISGATVRNLGTGKGAVNASTGTITVSSGNVTSSDALALENVTTGTVTVSGGTVTGKIGLKNTADGTATITGGTITGSSSYGIQNADVGSVSVSSGKVTGTVGIINQAGGTITVTGGTITGSSTNGIQNSSTGIITIGSSSAAYTMSSPLIIGETYGVHNASGTCNLYNGKMRGKTLGYYNYSTLKPTVKRSGYVLLTGTDTVSGTTYNTLFLGKSVTLTAGNTATVSLATTGGATGFEVSSAPNSAKANVTKITNNVVTITGVSNGTTRATIKDSENRATVIEITVTARHWFIGSTYYETLANAVSAASAGNTIKAYDDHQDTSTVTIGTNLTINTNGKTVTRTKTITINSGTTVTLAGTGTLQTSSAINLITVNGTLNVTHTGTIKNTCSSANNYKAISGTGSVNKTGNGTITACWRTIYLSGSGSFKMSAGTVNVSSSTVDSTGYAVASAGTCTGNISGGTITNKNGREAVYWNSSGALTISGGTLETTSAATDSMGALVADSSGTVTISNGTFTGNKGNGAKTYGTAKLTINGGTFTGNSGINVSGTGDVRVNAGTLNGTVSDGLHNLTTAKVYIGQSGTPSITGKIEGIFNSGTGNITIYKGNITGTTNCGINNQSTGTVTIENGTITGKMDGILNQAKGNITVKKGTITGGSGYAGIENGSTGVVTIGNASDTFNTNNPTITGGDTGLYNPGGGQIRMYNGICRGGVNAFHHTNSSNAPDTVRSGYTSKRDTSGGYYRLYLVTK